MANAEADFRKRFVESLAPLRGNGNAGFIFVFAAFPLLERYLRRKSGCPDGQNLTEDFFKHLAYCSMTLLATNASSGTATETAFCTRRLFLKRS
jgi:hypothetical protein